MMLPVLVDLKTWAASLIIDFPTDNIPILLDEKDWKRWGNLLILENTFSVNGAPETDQFNDWRTWAQYLFRQMANL